MILEKEFGLKLYKIKDAKNDSDTLIKNLNTEVSNTYSKTKARDVIRLEIRDKGFTLEEVFEKLTGNKKDPEDKKSFNTMINNLLDSLIEKEINLVDDINYKPVDDEVFEEEGKKYYNTYKKSNVLKKFEKVKLKKNKNLVKIKNEFMSSVRYEDKVLESYGNEWCNWEKYVRAKESFYFIIPKFYSIRNVIMHLVDYDEKKYYVFIHWLAHIIRKPLERLPTAVILMGTQGTGKTLLLQYVFSQIFGNNFKSLLMNDLNKKSSNEYVFGKQFIGAEEVMNYENKGELPNSLKAYVTNKTISIQRMSKKSIDVTNYSNWLFCSNEANPMKVEKDDRRYNVFRQMRKLPSNVASDFVNNVDNELESFLEYLYSFEIDSEILQMPLHTEERKNVQIMNLDSIDSFIDEFVDDNVFKIDRFKEFFISKQYNDSSQYFTILNSEIWVSLPIFFIGYEKWLEDEGQQKGFKRKQFTSQLKFKGWKDDIKKLNENSVRCVSLPEGFSFIQGEDENFDEEKINQITTDVQIRKYAKRGKLQ